MLWKKLNTKTHIKSSPAHETDFYFAKIFSRRGKVKEEPEEKIKENLFMIMTIVGTFFFRKDGRD
mgnify:CR=1 FL=1